MGRGRCRHRVCRHARAEAHRCSFCHGKQGEGHRQNEYYPRIAGKPPEYLYRQLVNFRDGRRTYPQMVYMSRHLSDEYLREIASYYSKLSPGFPTPIQPSATKEALARGEQIVRNGDQAKGIPACVACHGKALTGMLPGVPGLVGLYPDYINGQMGALAQRFAQGDRARLHGAHRAAAERRRQRRRGRVSREHPRNAGVPACAGRQTEAADELRQPAAIGGVR